MNRNEFIKALRYALSDVPSEEREEALQYYNDYLDDAGPENEQGILEEWGSPEKLAESIRNGMDGKLENGEFTEKGFSDGEERQCPARREPAGEREQERRREPEAEKSRHVNGWKYLAVGLLCLVLAPVCVPLVLVIVVTVLCLALSVVAVLAVLVVVGAALIAGGVVMAVMGIAKVFVVPAAAAVLFGAGLLLAAVGGLCVLLFGAALLKGSIALFRAFVNLCRKPFHGGGKAGARK